MKFSAITPEDETALVRRFFHEATQGVFIEVGANDGRVESQTWHLEELGWTGILVEPQTRLVEKLRADRPGSTVVQAACRAPGGAETADLFLTDIPGFSSLEPHIDDQGIEYTGKETVSLRTLDEIIAGVDLAGPIQYVSIDTEGTELEVLKGFTLEKHRPALVMIEDKMHDFGKHRYMTEHGYRLVKRTFMNNWYIPKEQPFELADPLEPWLLWRKMVLGMPIRRFRRWRHARRRLAAEKA